MFVLVVLKSIHRLGDEYNRFVDIKNLVCEREHDFVSPTKSKHLNKRKLVDLLPIGILPTTLNNAGEYMAMEINLLSA
jgi:hypothetical protein